METVTTYILSGTNHINIFIKKITPKQWIILYVTVAVICALYLGWFRIKKIREQELFVKSSKNTKRAKAIERFQNYSSQLATELNQKCDTELEVPDIISTSIPTQDKLFINSKFESAFMTQLSPDSQEGYNIGKELLENFLFVIDSKITAFVEKTKQTYDDILNVTIRNNQFVQEGKLDEQLDMLERQITDLELTLDSELKVTLPDGENTGGSIIRSLNKEEKAFKTLNFSVEVKERLFKKVSVDKQKIFRLSCQLRSQLRTLQAQIDSLNPSLSQSAYLKANKELDSVRLSIGDAEAKYKSYILILSRLATTSMAQDMLKRESAAMSTILIQPANESQIDDMAILKQKLATYADPGQVGNPVTNKAAEYDLAKKYSGAYQDYIDNMDTYTLNAKIDPIKIAGDLEEKTLNFLTKLNSNLRGDSTPENASAFSPVNRFGTQENNLGTWLVDSPENISQSGSNMRQGEPIPATDISKLSKFIGNTISENKEGFQDNLATRITSTQPNAINEAYGYLSIVDGFFKYAYEYIIGFMDGETADKLEGLLTSEDNMIPVGVILVFISIVLFLASSGGSSDSAK